MPSSSAAVVRAASPRRRSSCCRPSPASRRWPSSTPSCSARSRSKSLELAVASRHKSEFLASMSHELRTPLNAVLGFSEVLLERMFGEINERQEEYLRDIWSSGKHLLELLNEILDLSKVEAGQMELDYSTFDVREALEHSSSMLRERAAAHGLTLTIDIDTGGRPDRGRRAALPAGRAEPALERREVHPRRRVGPGARLPRGRRHRGDCHRLRRRRPRGRPGADLRVVPAGRPRRRERRGHRARADPVTPHRRAARGPDVAAQRSGGGQHVRVRHSRADVAGRRERHRDRRRTRTRSGRWSSSTTTARRWSCCRRT